MLDPNFMARCALQQEFLRREAALEHLLDSCHQPGLSLGLRVRSALGDLLINAGQRLKNAPRRLETEKASLSSMTIIL
jgi:hypothetical protein